ncbi:YrrS family protein [Fictibacillus barbaricus]|uniref:Cytoskeletal protein RodZ n=1 Tax=Fictibacillus barbaricus TaxID=182136 RepID=A0ABU1U2A1_9BACL|nr:YrrS family protein [Fictibacillus barbaricus]MDR7073598.1 cytoskeletal protein RodZ [Fictibacillus barbaricus]
MKRNERYATRSEKRKQNRFLNIAIGLVILLIVVVVYNLFSGSDEETASTSRSETQQSQTKTVNKEDDNSSIEMESDKDDQKSDETKTEGDSDNQSDSEGDQADSNADTPEGGGPEGPWEPIGTSQSEPHQKTYDDQSQDWKEMVSALSYATGIPEDQMTIFWLGNGGGPDLSKGTVQSKVDKVKYDVQLQWIPEKGWKPTSVTRAQ